MVLVDNECNLEKFTVRSIFCEGKGGLFHQALSQNYMEALGGFVNLSSFFITVYAIIREDGLF